MRRVERCGAQCPLDHGSDLIIVDSSWSTGAGLVKQTIAAIVQKSATPLANRVFMVAEFGSHVSERPMTEEEWIRERATVIDVTPEQKEENH